MRKGMLIGCVLMLASGCTSFSANRIGEGEGYLFLAADAAGLKAWNDGQNGLVSNSRIDPNLKSSYWGNRSEENQVQIIRFKGRAAK